MGPESGRPGGGGGSGGGGGGGGGGRGPRRGARARRRGTSDPRPTSAGGDAAARGTTVEVDGRHVALSNLDKVLYPAAGFTKAAVVDYYVRVAGSILPHLRRRALTMVRWPDGVAGPSFFEKRCPPHAPEWVVTDDSEADLVACVVDDLATLVWVANLAALELHTKQATVDDPDHPTSMVFDLDPGSPADVLSCAAVALELHDLLAELGLRCVVKTSGGKGLHLGVPVRDATADDTKEIARAIGRLLERRDPRRVTTIMRRDARAGKVFVDWSQNDRHKTTVAPYSLRAEPRPRVSTPVTWDELREALEAADATRLAFEAPDVIARVEAHGDLYAANLTVEQRLPDVRRR